MKQANATLHRIQLKRGEYVRARTKRYQYLKNTGQFDIIKAAKINAPIIAEQKKAENAVYKRGKVSMWKRFKVFVSKLFSKRYKDKGVTSVPIPEKVEDKATIEL